MYHFLCCNFNACVYHLVFSLTNTLNSIPEFLGFLSATIDNSKRQLIHVVRCAGEVISDVACEQRMQIAKQTGEPHFYMMELAPGLIIDARKKGNVARLINSSCAPNCESQKWHDAANGVFFVLSCCLRKHLHWLVVRHVSCRFGTCYQQFIV